MRTVRVIASEVRPSFGYRLPSTPGEASGRLARDGFNIDPRGFILLPLTVGTGALIGWLKGVPEETTRKAEAAITQAWGTMDVGGGFAREMCMAGGRVRAGEWSMMAPTGIPRRGGLGESRAGEYWLILQPVDVVLDVQETQGTVNPRLRLVLKAGCSIKRASDGKELVQLRREHRGPSHTFVSWSRNEARRLTEAVERGQRKLAEDMIAELLSW